MNSYGWGDEIIADSERQGQKLILSPRCRTPQKVRLIGGVQL